MILYQKIFPTGQVLRDSIVDTIFSRLSDINCSLSISRYDLMLVLDEAIANAMEHGNKWDINKNICIRLLLLDNRVQIQIQDEGQGFDNPEDVIGDPGFRTLNERGRGLLLIRELCDMEWADRGQILKLNIPARISA